MNLNLSQAQCDLLMMTVIPDHVDESVRDTARFEISTAGTAASTVAVNFGPISREMARAVGAYLDSSPGERDRALAEGVLTQLQTR